MLMTNVTESFVSRQVESKPRVTPRIVKVAPVRHNPTQIRAAFAARLTEVMKARKDVGTRERRGWLAAKFGVKYPSARKWLEGHSIPEMTTAIQMAVTLDIGVEWLLTGRGPRSVVSRGPDYDEALRLLERVPRPRLPEAVQHLRILARPESKAPAPQHAGAEFKIASNLGKYQVTAVSQERGAKGSRRE
ncbi:MAG: hypothetical protein ACRCZI_11125 [Cetobacterium sp.]